MPNGLGLCGRTMLERGLRQEPGEAGATWRKMLMKLVVLQSTAGSAARRGGRRDETGNSVRSDAVDSGVQYVPGTPAALRMRSV